MLLLYSDGWEGPQYMLSAYLHRKSLRSQWPLLIYHSHVES